MHNAEGKINGDSSSSLQSDGFFGLDKIYFYYIDNVENNNSSSVNKVVYSQNSYKDLINKMSENEENIVKIDVPSSSKVCSVSDEITEELLKQKKEEGFDIIIYDNNGEKSFVILNEDIIEEKDILNKSEAVEDCAKEEKKYEEIIKSLFGEKTEKVEKTEKELIVTEEMKKTREKLVKQMQMLGLLDIDETIDYTELEEASDKVSDTKININSGYLIQAINMLSNMDTGAVEINNDTSIFDKLDSLELKCDTSFIEEFKKNIEVVYKISSQGVESGLIQSYLTRLQSLRSSLESMNPDYSYTESVNYLLNMGEFAVDLDWSDEEIKEKAEEVGKNAKKVIYGKMNNVNGISKRNLYSKQNFSLYNDEAEEAKIILKDIDTLVAMNVDRTSNIAYKVAFHIELTENEKITYGKKRNDDGFKELLGKYEEASFDIASRKVNFGEPTEKELEIYNDEGNRSKYSEIYTRDISIQYLDISSIPEEERTEEQKKFLSANQSTILKYGEKVWNKYDIDSVDNSSEVNGILTLRADSLNLSADNITSLFGASANKNVNNSPYDRMSDGELYIINAFATIKLGKTIEMMQPALEREDQRKRLGAYKNVKDYYYGNFSAGTYINGEIDDNGTPIYGFGDQISEETKESLFRRNLGNSWATDMWCGYYYDDEAYYENVHVLNNSDKYDKPTVSEYKLLLSKENDLKRTAGYDKETIKKCNEDYVKYKTVILDSKATLILRTPEDKRTDDENDFLIERDQFKIGLETEKIGKEIAKNSKELEVLEETWGSTFEGLEKELKKYAKQKLEYGDKQLTAKDLEIVLEKYLNDPSTKSIKIKGAKKINSGAMVYSTVSLLVDALKRNNKGELDAKENKELILSAFKRRNELNQEQIKLSDKTAALQDVNLSLYSLYSNYDDNKAARIKKVEIKNVGTTFGQKFVYAYDENGNIIDITMADLAIYCKNNNQSELITTASIFNGPKLYCVGSDGQAKYLGHSVDVEDTITGINYHPNGDEYFGLISYLANMDAVNGTTIASTAAVEIADMGKRIEGARIAKERQEKLDTASENIGKVCLYLIAGPLGVAIDKINDNKASDHVGHFVTTVGSGLEDGVVQFGRGLYYAFGGADGKVSADDYARMYFAQGLLDNYGSFYQGTYEVCTSIGNMLPTVALTAIATAITVGTGGAAAPALAAFLKTSATVLMGVSAGGNSIEQGLQEGMTLAQALVYGTLSGASEALLEKFLGGIPGLSNTPNLGAKLFSSIGESILGKELVLKIASSSVVQLIHEMASEALEEGLQEILDPVFKAMVGREWEGIDWEAVGKSAFYGALTAGIMQGSGSMINSTTSTLLTGTSKGLNIALNQTLSQNKGGLINNFDIFKNNIEAIRQHSGSFELIKANLKVDANIKAKYEAYKSLYTNNISALETFEFMTFDQFVENLTYSSIIGLNSSESNMGIFKKRFIELTEKLNNINSKLESENDVNKIEKIKLEKGDIVKQLVQTTNQINQCRKLIGLNNNYYEAASIFSDSILASVYETIMEKQGKVEGLNEEINDEKSRVRIAENGEIIRDSVEEVTVEEMQQEGIPVFTPPSESEVTNIVESEDMGKMSKANVIAPVESDVTPITIEEFDEICEKMEQVLNSSYDNSTIDELMFSLKENHYYELQKELLSRDLSKIPVERLSSILFLPDENGVIDFSHTNATLDLSDLYIPDPTNIGYYKIIFKGCNLININSAPPHILLDGIFDSEFIDSHSDYLLSNLFDESFKQKYYNGLLTMLDLILLNDAQIEELLNMKNFKSMDNELGFLLKDLHTNFKYTMREYIISHSYFFDYEMMSDIIRLYSNDIELVNELFNSFSMAKPKAAIDLLVDIYGNDFVNKIYVTNLHRVVEYAISTENINLLKMIFTNAITIDELHLTGNLNYYLSQMKDSKLILDVLMNEAIQKNIWSSTLINMINKVNNDEMIYELIQNKYIFQQLNSSLVLLDGRGASELEVVLSRISDNEVITKILSNKKFKYYLEADSYVRSAFTTLLMNIKDVNVLEEILSNGYLIDFIQANKLTHIINGIEKTKNGFLNEKICEILYEKLLANGEIIDSSYVIPKSLINYLSTKFDIEYELLDYSFDILSPASLIYLNDENFRNNLREGVISKLLGPKILNGTFSQKTFDMIFDSVLSRGFAKTNPHVMNIFENIRGLVLTNDIEIQQVELSYLLGKIYENINCQSIINSKYGNFEEFYLAILSNNQSDMDFLHNELCDIYINYERSVWIKEMKQEIIDSKFIVNDMVTFDRKDSIKYLYSVFEANNILNILKSMNIEYSTEEIELLNNAELFVLLYNFKQNPNSVKLGEEKRKLRIIDQIMGRLYDNGGMWIQNILNNSDESVVKRSHKIEYDLASFSSQFIAQNLLNIFTQKVEISDGLLELMENYKIPVLSTIFSDDILEKWDCNLDEETVSTIIESFSFLNLVIKNSKKPVTILSIIDFANTLTSSALAYNSIFGKENADYILNNRGTYPGTSIRRERKVVYVEDLKKAFKRKLVTIPTYDMDFSIDGNKKINVVVGNYSNPITLSYGQRTDACMRYKSAGEALYRTSLENVNGFHIRFSDPETGKFVSRISGFRNGNIVVFNQLRHSVDSKYTDTELQMITKQIAEKIIADTKDSEHPIECVTINIGYGMEKADFETVILNKNLRIGNLLDSLAWLDNNGTNEAYLLASTGKEVKTFADVGESAVDYYEVQRDKIIIASDAETATDSVKHILAMDKLLSGSNVGEIGSMFYGEFIDENTFEPIQKYKECVCGEDWFVAIDKSGKINYYIMENSNNKETAKQELLANLDKLTLSQEEKQILMREVNGQ